MTNTRIVVFLTVAALSGCLDAPAWETFPKPKGSATETGTSSSGEGPAFTSDGDGILTTTVEPGPTSTTDEPSDTAGTTAALPEPLIDEHLLDPNPLMFAGPITVSIATKHAAGVRMSVDGGTAIELAPAGADLFTGEIVMVSAQANPTPHEATFTAWRDGLTSDPVSVEFAVKLPEMGSKLFWESGALIGKGVIAALAVTATGDVLEFGTYYPQNEARCYLRRRNPAGAWIDDELLPLLDTTCTAIDMKIGPAGEIFTLARRTDNGDTRWTLGKQTSWGGELKQVGQGTVGEEAFALATHPEMVAVCGARPQPVTLDLDAFVATFRPEKPGFFKEFDYVTNKPHAFSETARDCVFVGDGLALVGEAQGKHDGEMNPLRDRLFVLELAANTFASTWTVAPAGPGTQSGATGVVVDEQGRLILSAFTCDDTCDTEGALRIFSPGVGFEWPVSLGLGVKSPHDIAWHPAGYAVTVGARQIDPLSTMFWVQAWIPGDNQPLWTAEYSDAATWQVGFAVAVGPYGQVVAGGMGALGYPAIAYIGG